ncbi:MAG: hypothetical protein SGBAC_000631 [Bacillariaceae sp.]
MTATDVKTVKPGKLLELANFLTRFQKHYSTPNDRSSSNNNNDRDDGESRHEASDTILIKINDLVGVTEYRRHLSKRESLMDRHSVANEGSKTKSPAQAINRLQAKRLAKEIEIANSNDNSISKRIKRIHLLLQRFEVWSSKVLAHKDLVAPCGAFLEDTNKTTYSHFSPHLNVPCSDHFCRILPGVSRNDWSIPRLPSAIHHMPKASCTLPLTPNRHTWQEFAKISRMLSLLDETSRTEIYKCSSCIFELKSKNSYKEIYNQQYEFQPLDLMALWVRAQRNSQAMRHLHLLFEVQHGNQDNPSGLDDGAEATKSPSKIHAIYRGNPVETRRRICETSPWVDQLVEWAVTNQTLFSYHQVRSHIQLALLKRKRKRHDEEARSKPQRKRQRRDGNLDEQDIDQVRQACHIGCREGDRNGANLLHEKVDTGIKNYLLKPEIEDIFAVAKDRTLARIDRRVHKYGSRITLQSQVETLLDALYSAGKSHGVRSELIEDAKADWRMLHHHFLEEPEHPLETAAMLVDIGDESITNISNLLNGVPSPWKQHCGHCDLEGVENNELRTCACCASPFHEGCTVWKCEAVSDIISSYPPLREVCTVKLPPTHTLPDFRSDNAITWTEMELLVERRLDDVGWLEISLGLSVAPTESCYDSFKKLTNDTVLDLAKMIAADKGNKRPSFPMALNVNGSLIYDVADGDCAGRRAGLRKGDVIQHLQIVEVFEQAGISSIPPKRSFDFQAISTDDRMRAFKIPAKKLKVRVLRPSIDVVQSSHDWYEQVKVRNKIRTTAMNDICTGEICSNIWHCGNCLDHFTPEKQTPRSVKEEAEFCRAVIRRIGMEAYARSFEDERTEGNNSGPIVSLRRLDAMMTHFVDRQSVPDKVGELPARSFLNPPWGVESGSHLAWAAGLEERPMELLCKGFGTMLESMSLSTNRESMTAAEVTAVFHHFLVAFSSWCFLACKGNQRTRGPPPLFRSMKTPWISPSCTTCAGRPVADGSTNICGHPACSAQATSNYFQVDEFADEEVAGIAEDIENYENRSSLVGTTFLVHHDDPLVKTVSKVVKIEHNRRPVEFIIASYLPKEFRDTILNGNQIWEGDKCSDNDGIFHLLPVITATQINFLLDRLKTRKTPTVLESTDDASWASIEALDLDGVARYSFSELKRKLFESAIIHTAMEAAIVRKFILPSEATGDCNGVVDKPSRFELVDLVVSQLEPLNSVAYGNCLTSVASHLLSQDEFQRGAEIVESRSRSTPRSNWPIVARAGNGSGQDLFGTTLPLPRPRLISCVPEVKYDVLIPKEDECVLVYSDLHFANDEDCASLKQQLQPKVLDKPKELNLSSRRFADRTKTILFVNLESKYDSGYKGIGWGFELVRWEHEEALRVGRMCAPSPAQRAGLQTNDVITSVGGRKINSFDQVNLISTILGASNVCVRTEDTLVEPEGIISIVLGNIAESCKLDPVVLKVYRPAQDTDESLALSSSDLQHVAPRNGTQMNSGSIHLNSTESSNQSDDDEVLVLGTISHSTLPNELHAISHHVSQDSRTPQDPSRQLASRVAATANVSIPLARQDAAPAAAFVSLYTRLCIYNDQRPVLRIDQIYFPAENGVVLTLGETALFLECFRRQQPKLGVRLLCPRYNTTLIWNQLKIMETWTPQVIKQLPKLTDAMYEAFMKLDYKRATNQENPETGEVVFREANPNATSSKHAFWSYLYPVDILPIDRCLERFLVSQQQAMSQQMHYRQQLHHHDNQPPPHNGSPPNGMVPPLYHGPPHHGMAPPPQRGPPPNPLEPLTFGYQLYDTDLGSYTDGERIRGGGTTLDDEISSITRLSEIPVERWDGLPVYTLVQTEESEKLHEEKMLVGFVKPPSDVQLVPEMTMDVECHFLEDHGEFEAAHMHQAASNEIFAIDMTANDGYSATASSVIRDLYANEKGPLQNRLNHTNGTDPSSQIQDDGDQKISIDASELSSSPRSQEPQKTLCSNSLNQTEQTKITPESRQDALLDAYSNSTPHKGVPKQSSSLQAPKRKKGQMNYFGDLPDGRGCFWIANDPEALYITTEQLNNDTTTKICQQQYAFFLGTEFLPPSSFSQRLVMRHSDQYHCPWGCSVAREDGSEDKYREALSFTSQQDLVDHFNDCFSYGNLSSFVDVGPRCRCIRISDGQKIRDLYYDLSSALYARSSIFDFFTKSEQLPTKKCKSGRLFSQSPTGKRLSLVINDSLSLKIEQVQETLSVHESTIVCDLVHLLEKISSLFEVKTTGNLRFDDQELLKHCLVEETRSLRGIVVNERERVQDKKESSWNSMCTNCVGCDLCTLPWEKTVSLEPNSSGIDSGTRFGSGCCLINKLIRNSEMPKSLPGGLGEAKVLILEIGDIVPNQLKVRGQRKEFDPLMGCRLWDENNHGVWTRFVTEATCPRQLTQAYVTLLASIEKELLPGWWRTDGAGWSTSQVLLVSGKLSSLLLHVYVLDAAIAEYMCQKLYKVNTGPSSSSMMLASQMPKPRKVRGTTMERMKKYKALAKKQGYQMFEGANKSECCMCDDGGELLCCDLCDNVQHAACCEPRIDCNPKSLDTFICHVCINDIEDAMEFT